MNRWLPMPKACEYSGLCRKTVRKLLLEGELRGDRVADTPRSHWRVDRESIDDYFNRTDEKILARLRGNGL